MKKQWRDRVALKVVAASLIVSVAVCGRALAATSCVDSLGALQAALGTAGAKAQADDIRVQTGTYLLAGPLFYAPTDTNLTTVSGGWNAGCSVQSGDAAATVLDAGGLSQILGFNAGVAAGNLTIANLTIQNGYSTTHGACLFVHTAGDFKIQNTRLSNCTTTSIGGALYVDAVANVVVQDTTLDHNAANLGAAMLVDSATSITLDHATIQSNNSSLGSALASGGGQANPSIQIVDSEISNNTGMALYGGGISIDIENSHFANNVRIDPNWTDECGFITAGSPGLPDGVGGQITIRNSRFEGSGVPGASCFRAGASNGTGPDAIAALLISGSDFSGFTFGVLSTLSTPSTTIDHSIFSSNSGYTAIDDTSASLHITHSRFTGNTASGDYSAALTAQLGLPSVVVDNSVFDNNSSSGDGGAIGIKYCPSGPGCATTGSAAVTLTNNTFVANTATRYGGAIMIASKFDAGPSIQLWNNLFWQNTAGSLGHDIYYDDDADGNFVLTPMTLGNNAYDAVDGLFIRVFEMPLGSDNVAAVDPVFIAPDTGNYRLQSVSPMIDLGSAVAPSLNSTDAAGLPRVYGTAPDIGAYEYTADIIFQSGFDSH